MKPATTKQNLSSSFRDPSGFLFKYQDKLYRYVDPCYQEEYDSLLERGLYESLTQKALMIPHKETSLPILSEAYKIIEPQLVPFISYPYEWSFTQLKDAALLTLEIQKMALKQNMSLKDASAYNIQFLDGAPIFIDTLSFERYIEGKPWVAYRQFCQHFYAPLVLASHADIRLFDLLRTNIDGIPLDLASSLLPRKTHFKLAIKMHIHMHAKAQQKYSDKSITKEPYLSKNRLLAIIDNLESSIKKLSWKPEGTEWANYYENTNYSNSAQSHKAEWVRKFIKDTSPKSVWDLGANDGRFSRIAAQQQCQTLAFDVDPSAVEKNYLQTREKNETLLPLIMDLTNPSPAIGWNNRERMSLLERGPADMVLALALIHHLAISNNVPFPLLASFFAHICHHLIIEFVPKNDSKVQRLLQTRKDIFDHYTQKDFEHAFGQYFDILEKEPIKNSERHLYLMKTRHSKVED